MYLFPIIEKETSSSQIKIVNKMMTAVRYDLETLMEWNGSLGEFQGSDSTNSHFNLSFNNFEILSSGEEVIGVLMDGSSKANSVLIILYQSTGGDVEPLIRSITMCIYNSHSFIYSTGSL